MAIDYHINARDDLITVTASGAVTAADACAGLSEMLNDVNFDAQLPQLVDLRQAELEGSQADLKHFESFLLTDYRSRLNAGVAIVVNPEWAEDICAQAFWMCCALYRAELFDNWSQACKWLITKEFSAPLNDQNDQEDASEQQAEHPQ